MTSMHFTHAQDVCVFANCNVLDIIKDLPLLAFHASKLHHIWLHKQ